MQAIWFALVSIMLAVYVVLDGFDFGAGILHLFVARTDEERRQVLSAIGPLWDGNEVWLIAAGGSLVFAFPQVYAVGFSGFYLPLMMALWLLILRGLSIEFRSHEAHPLWRSFWDGLFAFSSTLMAVILGAALGCILRGVPITKEGYFIGPLFTNFRVGPHPGVLDWYTVMVGVFALLALTLHGALYLNWKTTGEVQRRCRKAALPLWGLLMLMGAAVTIATNAVQPLIFQHLVERPWTWLLALTILAGAVSIPLQLKKERELPAFLGSSAILVGMLAATAAGLFPLMLRSTLAPAWNLTALNASNGREGLATGLVWWLPAVLLATLYFVYLFRSFRGKVVHSEHG